MKGKNKGVIGVMANIYIGVMHNLVNFSVNLCHVLLNRVIFNLFGFNIEKITEENEKEEKEDTKVGDH